MVPGCTGAGVSYEDYCTDRPGDYLFYVGDSMGQGNFGLCEGDCDDDVDCGEILICCQRR